MEEILQMFGGAEDLWTSIMQNANKVGRESTKTLLELFYVMKSPETSVIDKGLIMAALAYQLLPEDALPKDKFGILGMLDNGAALAFAYNKVKSSVTPAISMQVNNILKQWFEGTEDNTIYGSGEPARPIYENPSVPGTRETVPSYNGATTIPSRSTPVHKPQTWDDDEDVVID